MLGRYASSCKVKLTVQRAVNTNLTALVDEGEADQLITPPSVLKILTGEGPSPGDVQSMLKKLPYMALYMTRRGITESSPDLADVLYQYPPGQQSKLLQVWRNNIAQVEQIICFVPGPRNAYYPVPCPS